MIQIPKLEEASLYFCVILISFTICLGYILRNMYFLLFLCFIGLIFTIIINRKIFLKITWFNIMWLMTPFICFMWSFISPDPIRAFKYSITISVLAVIIILLQNKDKWQKVFINSLWIFSSIHVIATLMRNYEPSLINLICQAILPSEKLVLNMQLFEFWGNPGITSQTMFNAFYISIFIAITIAKTIGERKNKKLGMNILNILFIMSGLIALFQANKRGVLLAILISAIILLLIISRLKFKAFMKYILFITVGVFLMVHAIQEIPETNAIFERIANINENTLGRVNLYNTVVQKISENPFIGYGTSSADTVLNTGAHDVYLQLWLEYGLSGFLLYISVFSISLIRSIKHLLHLTLVGEYNPNEKIFLYVSIQLQVLFLVVCFTDNPLYEFDMLTMYVLMIAISESLILKKRRR